MPEFSTTPTIPESINIQSMPITSIAEADKQLSKYIKRWDEIYRYLRADMFNVFGSVRRDGTTTFTGLTDTPDSYLGESLKILQVKAGESGLEFTDSPTFEDVNITGTLTTGGGRIKNTSRYTTTQIIPVTDDQIFCNTDAGAWTATLPEGVEGQSFKIINSGSSSNNLTIAPDGVEKLIGENSNFTLYDGEALIVTYNAEDGWY